MSNLSSPRNADEASFEALIAACDYNSGGSVSIQAKTLKALTKEVRRHREFFDMLLHKASDLKLSPERYRVFQLCLKDREETDHQMHHGRGKRQ